MLALPVAGGFVLIGHSRVARRRCRHHRGSSGHWWSPSSYPSRTAGDQHRSGLPADSRKAWQPGLARRRCRAWPTHLTWPDPLHPTLPSIPSRHLHRVGGVNVQRPQRSEDERPGGRRGWRNTDPAGSGQAQRRWSCRFPSSCAPKISQGESRVRLPVIPSPLWWRHEAVQLQQGGINQGGDHATVGWES